MIKPENQQEFYKLRDEIVRIIRKAKDIGAEGSHLCASALNEAYAGYDRCFYVRYVEVSALDDPNRPYRAL